MPFKFKTISYTLLYIGAILLLASCQHSYHIGVSQCVGGPWRDKVNEEMLTAQYLFDKNVKVDIVNANDKTDRQVQQVDSMIDAGVDLLIISPNEDAPLKASLLKAKKKGIPVVLFDRKTEGHYTAFIGGDNVDAGAAMATYAVSISRNIIAEGRKPKILELNGPGVSTPDRERHIGFKSVMSKHPEMDYRVEGTMWTRETSDKELTRLLKQGYIPDIVFCHSDWAAYGACDAAKTFHLDKQIRVLGVDGLPGKGEGIEAVKNGMLAGTYIYPTHGSDIIALAVNILDRKPFSKVNNIKSIVVTPENATSLELSGKVLTEREHQISFIHERLEKSMTLYHLFRSATIIFFALLVLAGVAIILIIRAIRKTKVANKRLEELSKEQKRFRESSGVVNDFYKTIEPRISDSNLRIDDIAAEMGMSRTQLYRKLKDVMNIAPNDLLKDIRLNKARKLLRTSSDTIAEVAFAVGFASQSYFTSCYKQKFGRSPRDDRFDDSEEEPIEGDNDLTKM